MVILEQLILQAARDLINSTYAIALTGAGISTESGIPDYRGPSGVWTKNPEAERRAFRGYERFLEDPKMWWEERLSSSSLLGDLRKAMPNSGHYALVALEEMGILKCVITQNVDALHERAGTKNLLEYHGSVLKLRCISCGSRYQRDEFDLEQLRQENLLPPICPRCGGIIKTDGVAFGEPIPRNVANRSLEEVVKCNLMLICGTSAVVYPFAELPRAVKRKKANTVTIIEINAEPTPLTHDGISNYFIQGKTGEILPRIVEEVKRIRNL
ncbi:NAD-dependent deacylase [Candidatus Bathyarchaeota archaeon]|nr:NAD-dependent deacylase [Candidatus Bathyarchaeota archaeon]